MPKHVQSIDTVLEIGVDTDRPGEMLEILAILLVRLEAIHVLACNHETIAIYKGIPISKILNIRNNITFVIILNRRHILIYS
jgi:hypothetical protein